MNPSRSNAPALPSRPPLRSPVALENIEGMRCRAGIDDVELRGEIRRLRIGDTVNLTFLKDAITQAGETLAVRITSIRGAAFRGQLAAKPAAASLVKLRIGVPVVFRTMHIHSIPKRRPADER